MTRDSSFPGHAVGEIQLAGLQSGHAAGSVPDALDDDRLGGRRAAPVLVPRLERPSASPASWLASLYGPAPIGRALKPSRPTFS